MSDTYPPALPWAVHLDADDLEDFLADLADAASGGDDLDTLADVESAIAGWRAFGEATAAHRAAPGPAVPRCPAAHRDDPTPCTGPVVVTVLDAQNAGVDGCEHHAARLLASLEGGRVYRLPGAIADGAAIRVFLTAADLPPFAWTHPTHNH